MSEPINGYRGHDGSGATLTFADIEAAAGRLAEDINHTPVFTSALLDEQCGCAVFLKCENLQRAGAFKIRGALNKLRSLTAEQRVPGVVAYSSGNHAQGVALAARITGCQATILMPEDAPASKLAATRGYGAEVRFYDRLRGDREAQAKTLAVERGCTLVPPYDDLAVMAGQGTVALELLQQAGPLDALLAPVGGGGLLAGCSVAARALAPDMALYGVEPALANDTWLSLRAGTRISIAAPMTCADGLRSTAPGRLSFPILASHLHGVLLVDEEEIRAAMRFVLLRMKLVVEPSGAVALAALMHGRLPTGPRRVGVVLSGGNVDAKVLRGLLH